MKIFYTSEFINKLKRENVRIRKSFRKQITIFQNNSSDPALNNHPLQREYTGYNSINITPDYRAVFKEVQEDGEIIYRFVMLGTHKQLYAEKKNAN